MGEFRDLSDRPKYTKMGEGKLDSKVMKKTQDTLGKIIKKPPMTEKLLSKPPFRFLHDVMTSVIKSTGFTKGLYTNAESQSDNVKEKEAKVAFLQKSIDIVSLVTGKTVPARPSKIVAGQEADKTNEFLQMLAEAINKKVDNDDYVQRVLKGDSGGSAKPPAGDKKEKKDRDRKKDRDEKKDRDGDDDKEKRHRSKDRDREKDDRRKDRKDRKERGDREGSKDRERSREKSADRRHRDKDEGSSDRHKDRERKRREKDREAEKSASKEREPPQENGEAEGGEQEEGQ